MFERLYLKSVKARIEERRKFIRVILGPRQVGKNTMVTQLLSQLSIPNLYESADAISATNSARLMQVWESARLRMKASVESSVGTHLINSSISERYNLYYLRDGNYEVVFVLEKGDKAIGLDVKSGTKAEDIDVIIFLEKFHPEKILLVVARGIPYNDFLWINPK